MKIGILVCGPLDPELAAIDGDHDVIYATRVANVRPDAEIALWIAYRDEIPNDEAEADLWIVTGSRYGVYDGAPWMARLEDFLKAAYAAGAPILGVCFGHQMLARALGGEAAKSDKGWGVGLLAYDVVTEDAAFAAPGETLRLFASHQDQVLAAPDGARVWLRSDFCPIAGLALGPEDAPTALTIQPHPEYSARFMDALIRARAGVRFPKPLAEAALAGLAPDPESGVRGDPVLAGLIERLAPRARARAHRRAEGA